MPAVRGEALWFEVDVSGYKVATVWIYRKLENLRGVRLRCHCRYVDNPPIFRLSNAYAEESCPFSHASLNDPKSEH